MRWPCTAPCTALLAVTAAVAAPALAAAQGSFEGTVTYQVNNDNGKAQTMEYAVKGSKVRFNMSGESTGMMAGGGGIYDTQTGTMTTVIPQMKAYMTMNLGDAASGSKMAAHMDSAMSHYKVTKTGTETVAGTSCDDYDVVDTKTNDHSFACVAHGMGNWMMMGKGNMGRGGFGTSFQSQQLADLFKDGFFPLKMGKYKGGKPDVQMVATKIERKSMDASEFAPPPGYKEMNMADMMNAAKQGQHP